jgi:hypothetical protein
VAVDDGIEFEAVSVTVAGKEPAVIALAVVAQLLQLQPG